jgi:hypothetical protein
MVALPRGGGCHEVKLGLIVLARKWGNFVAEIGSQIALLSCPTLRSIQETRFVLNVGGQNANRWLYLSTTVPGGTRLSRNKVRLGGVNSILIMAIPT